MILFKLSLKVATLSKLRFLPQKVITMQQNVPGLEQKVEVCSLFTKKNSDFMTKT